MQEDLKKQMPKIKLRKSRIQAFRLAMGTWRGLKPARLAGPDRGGAAVQPRSLAFKN